MKKINLMLIAMLLLVAAPALAQRDGWDRDSKYNHFFNADSMVYLTGQITNIDREHKPMPGMTNGFAVTLKTEDGKSHLVEVGPAWFTKFYAQKWDVAVGDTVDIRGSQTKVDGKDVIMAVWGRKGDVAMTVRNLKGAPIWDLDLTDF